MEQSLTAERAQEVLSAVNPMQNLLDPEQFNHMARVAGVLAKSSIVPQNYQNKPEDCLIALDMASRIGTNPLMVMQNLYVVKGKPAWSGQACAAMVQNCGRFESVRHVRTGEVGTDSRGCYYVAKRIDNGEDVRGVEVTIGMAKAEGWTANSKWKNLPELMLNYRAAAFFAREHCPDILMGCQTDAELYDISAASKKAAPITDALKGGAAE